MLQVLPDASDEEVTRYEKRIQEMPAISSLLEEDNPTEALLKAIYGEDEYKILAEEKIRFHCDCSRDRFEGALVTLGKDELKAMKDEDHGAEITCQFCGKTYGFTEDDLEELINA